jgi:hypothetical protein
MPASEPLAVLLGELDAMPPADRAAILGALSRKERDQLTSLVRTSTATASHGPRLSSWLTGHVECARLGQSMMTSATRDALLRAAGSGVSARESQQVGRSLAGAFGGLLAPRGAAR